MLAMGITTYRETWNRRRKFREISDSLSRIDSVYFIRDLIRLARQDPEYEEMVESLGLTDDDIIKYYAKIAINFPDNDILWVDGDYTPASLIYYRATLYYIHSSLQSGEPIETIVRACHRYFVAGSRGAVRNYA